METPFHHIPARTLTLSDRIVRRVLLPLIFVIGSVGLVYYIITGSGGALDTMPTPLQTTTAP